jgi:GR25 family glycosyltransferase involved in LPS biosynthesis
MIIVLCPEKSNRSERWNFNESIQREYGYWKTDEELLDKIKDYKFMPSTKTENKLSKIACSEGHLNIWKRIINENLENVLICEDDSVIDLNKFNEFLELSIPEAIIYLGGRFDFPKIKDWTDSREEIENYMNEKYTHKNGFNKVKDDFIITGAHGYFIKNKNIAKQMIEGCKGKTGKYKSNLTDVCIAKIDIDKFYYYPSIVNIEPLPSTLGHFCDPESTFKNYVK